MAKSISSQKKSRARKLVGRIKGEDSKAEPRSVPQGYQIYGSRTPGIAPSQSDHSLRPRAGTASPGNQAPPSSDVAPWVFQDHKVRSFISDFVSYF